jgi:hypothetical protein
MFLDYFTSYRHFMRSSSSHCDHVALATDFTTLCPPLLQIRVLLGMHHHGGHPPSIDYRLLWRQPNFATAFAATFYIRRQHMNKKK